MKNIVLITISMVLTQSLFAQKGFSIKSDKLKRTVSVSLQTPTNYQASKSYPWVFMLNGHSENYVHWVIKTDAKQLGTDYQMIFVCTKVFVNYYLNSPNLETYRYEVFFFQELVPNIEEKYNIDNKNIFITGLSMGGYGALSLFIKHSEFFNTAASTSGALEFDYENLKNVSLKFFESERMTNDMEMTLGNPK